jgi:hypothetical protein
MARPFKKPEDRKNYHLRVPLTEAQRQLIESACHTLGEDMAKWSRDILLDAAKRIAKKNARQNGGNP